eukprot:9379318-Alexandrium_andersonii.AAC.1
MTSGRDPAHGRHRNPKRRSIAACMPAHLVGVCGMLLEHTSESRFTVSCIAHMLRCQAFIFVDTSSCSHGMMLGETGEPETARSRRMAKTATCPSHS